MSCFFIKTIALVVSVSFVFSSAIAASADIVWSENFDSYSDGDSVDGQAASVGSGTLNTRNSVAVSNGALVLDANGGTERLFVNSDADALCGCFGYTLAITEDPDNPNFDPDGDQIFGQILEGQTFSTNNTNGGNPGPSDNFNFSHDISNQGISADPLDPSDVKVYFNVSGEDFTYTENGITRTLASGSRALWVDGIFRGDSSASANGASAPSALNTIAFATFGGQEGRQYHFDDIFLDSAAIHAVPEPGSLVILAGMALLGLTTRRRK